MLMICTRPKKNEVSNFLYKFWKKLPSITATFLSDCSVIKKEIK